MAETRKGAVPFRRNAGNQPGYIPADGETAGGLFQNAKKISRRMSRAFLMLAVFSCLAGMARAEKPTPDPSGNFAALSWDDAKRLGNARALDDFKKGTCRILIFGLRAGPTESEKKLEKLGVKFDAIAGCLVSEGIRGYAEGYNTTMLPLLKKRFGADVFRE